MKTKKHYPLRLTIATLGVVVSMLLIYPEILGGVLAFGIVSGLAILRQSEALYLIVLVSFMLVFFDTMLMIGIDGREGGMRLPGVAMLLQLGVLTKLSYVCFGAVAGGGNYK